MTVEALRAQLDALRVRWLAVVDEFERDRAVAIEQNLRITGLTAVIMSLRKAADELKEVMDGTWAGPRPDSSERRH